MQTDGQGVRSLCSLTPREQEVLGAYLQLFNDKMVARVLGISIQTVRNHLAAIEHRLDVTSREELVAFAVSQRRI